MSIIIFRFVYCNESFCPFALRAQANDHRGALVHGCQFCESFLWCSALVPGSSNTATSLSASVFVRTCACSGMFNGSSLSTKLSHKYISLTVLTLCHLVWPQWKCLGFSSMSLQSRWNLVIAKTCPLSLPFLALLPLGLEFLFVLLHCVEILPTPQCWAPVYALWEPPGLRTLLTRSLLLFSGGKK